MIKIGDFSRLGRISVKALRYYDEIGLLKPVNVDQFTGYRYYSADQLSKLNYITVLKNMGLSLEEIETLINNSLTPYQMKDLLVMKKGELKQRLSEEQSRLEQVEKLLTQIEKEGTVPDYKVVIKKTEPQTVASMRGILPTYGDVGEFYGEIFKYLAKKFIFKPSGYTMMICHDSEYKEHDVDVEIAVPIKKAIPDSDKVKVYELPGLEQAACFVHKGHYDNINEGYAALMTWMETNGYEPDGQDREVFVTFNEKDPSKNVTEIQFPVKKTG